MGGGSLRESGWKAFHQQVFHLIYTSRLHFMQMLEDVHTKDRGQSYCWSDTRWDGAEGFNQGYLKRMSEMCPSALVVLLGDK